MPDLGRVARSRVGRTAASGLATVLQAAPVKPADLAVLNYHRVAPPCSRTDLHPGLAVTVDDFREQMTWLAAKGCVVHGEAVVAACTGGPALTPGSVLITFDDAYADVAEHAWPILTELGLPAVLFVPTAFPDNHVSFWWDALYAALLGTDEQRIDLASGAIELRTTDERSKAFRALRAEVVARPHHEGMALVEEIVRKAHVPRAASATMSWSDIVRLADEGLAMAPHSRRHPRLDRLPVDELDEEIAGSLDDLRRQVPDALALFAYPGGGHDAAVREATARAGIVAAFTTERGVNGPPDADPMRIRRVNVGAGTSLGAVRAQLNPGAHLLLRAATGHRSRAPQADHRSSRGTTWS